MIRLISRQRESLTFPLSSVHLRERPLDPTRPKSMFPSTSAITYWQVEHEDSIVNGNIFRGSKAASQSVEKASVTGQSISCVALRSTDFLTLVWPTLGASNTSHPIHFRTDDHIERQHNEFLTASKMLPVLSVQETCCGGTSSCGCGTSARSSI